MEKENDICHVLCVSFYATYKIPEKTSTEDSAQRKGKAKEF